MRVVLLLLIITRMIPAEAQPFQLAPPRLHYASVFFEDSMVVTMQFDQQGTAIRYTLDGSVPNEYSEVYSKPLVIRRGTTLHAISTGKNFIASEPVVAHFLEQGKKIRQLSYSPPHEVYTGRAENILMDQQGGNPDFRRETWLGYEGDSAVFNITLQEKQAVRRILLNMLRDENSWIFLPEQLTVYYYDEAAQHYVEAGSSTFTHDQQGARECVPHIVSLSTAPVAQRLRIKVKVLPKIPEWHTGKGNKAWFFTDEIKVY